VRKLANNNGPIEAGYGMMNGRPMYYEQHPDGTHIFPDGMPRGHHSNFPHDHMFVNPDGGVEYMRQGNQVVNNYRNWQNNR